MCGRIKTKYPSTASYSRRIVCLYPTYYITRPMKNVSKYVLCVEIQQVWFCPCLAGQKLSNEEVPNFFNKRLGQGWEELLPPSFRKHNIIFVCGDPVGPRPSSKNNDLSINWCLGDKKIEVLDSSKGLIIER